MKLQLVKIWPDELVQFKDESEQEVRVFPYRRPGDSARRHVAVTIGDEAKSSRCQYFQRRANVWFMQDKSYDWFELSHSGLHNTLESYVDAWLNAIMMA